MNFNHLQIHDKAKLEAKLTQSRAAVNSSAAEAKFAEVIKAIEDLQQQIASTAAKIQASASSLEKTIPNKVVCTLNKQVKLKQAKEVLEAKLPKA
ncbi:hypothetical protein GE061_010053 [Apolygus lucorum]|uniref:Uncharacterized protein n=1 Tax=Apolygus lucorum TaxID=248454 RepID=A0A6A4KHS7_APOLU|nr:hypothetical protein GE061_010053 [Apolygus lucorum]